MAKNRSVIPFISREDYPELLRVVDDPRNLPADYDFFLKDVDTLVEEVKQAGLLLVKVSIRPAELAQWCRIRHRPIDRAARAAYALFLDEQINGSR